MVGSFAGETLFPDLETVADALSFVRQTKGSAGETDPFTSRSSTETLALRLAEWQSPNLTREEAPSLKWFLQLPRASALKNLIRQRAFPI